MAQAITGVLLWENLQVNYLMVCSWKTKGGRKLDGKIYSLGLYCLDAYMCGYDLSFFLSFQLKRFNKDIKMIKMLLMIVKLAMKSCLKLVEFWNGHKARIIAEKKRKNNSNGSIVALLCKMQPVKGKTKKKKEVIKLCIFHVSCQIISFFIYLFIYLFFMLN